MQTLRTLDSQTSWSLDTPKMKELWFKYYSEMESLFRTIMIIFARALELSDDFFLSRINQHESSLRIVHYPAVGSEIETIERAGEHTDWGCLTILKQDPNVGGTSC